MYAIASFMYIVLHVNSVQLKLHHFNLRLAFNHCKILNYHSHSNIKRYSKMSFCCDLKYNDEGNFIPWSNSQVDNTPTVIVTFGDNRKLHWRCLKKISKTNGWVTDTTWKHSTAQDNNHILLLNPIDENLIYMRIVKLRLYINMATYLYLEII